MRIVAGTALAGAVAAIALASAAAAVGSPTWSAPVQLSVPLGGFGFGTPSVAMDPGGDAVVGWTYHLGSNGLAQVVSRSAGSATWSTPLNLADGIYGGGPTLAMDALGNAFAAFTKGDLLSAVVQVSERTGPRGTWEDPVTLSSQPPAAFGPWVVVGPAGDVGVLASQYTGHGYVLQGTVRRAGGSIWTPLTDVSDAVFGALAIDAGGAATAIWQQDGGYSNSSMMKTAEHSPVTNAWGPSVDVPGSSNKAIPGYVDPQIALDRAGNATATWVNEVPGSLDLVVESSYRPFGGTWTPAVTISGTVSQISYSALAVDPAGNAVALWQVKGGVQSALRPATASAWHTPVELTPDGRGPQLAMDRAGNAVAIWTTYSSVQAALRPAASGVWQPPTELDHSNFEGVPAVAMGATGHALAVWEKDSELVASDLDPSGPIITSLKVPASATAKVASSFSVQAVPWASPLRGSPVWQLGDGSTATGQSVTHVYAKPGRYTVTVSQADATGTSSSTAEITVTAPTLRSISQPSIKGVPRVGHSLLCLTGIWTGTAPIRYVYTWLRDRTAIQSAHGRRYTVHQRDRGMTLACRVTAKNPAGAISKTSTSVTVKP